MSRQTSHECPVPGCRERRLYKQAVCTPCWRRLPQDLRGAIQSAKAEKAPHREAKAAIAATSWLVAHPVGAAGARVCGDSDGFRYSGEVL